MTHETSPPQRAVPRSRRAHASLWLAGIVGVIAASLLAVDTPAGAATKASAKAASSQAVDSDYDGMPDEQEDRLLQKFAPKIYMHPGEKFKLANVDDYLLQTEMRFNRKGGCEDYSVLKPGTNNQMELISQARYEHSGVWPVCGDSSNLIRSTDKRTDYDKDGFFLEHDYSKQDQVRAGDMSKAKIYGHAFTQPNGVIELQYWFFYAYDEMTGYEGIIGHQGDWEHVRLELQANSETLQRMNYAAHHDGAWKVSNEITWANSAGAESNSYGGDYTHPVVYAAQGKHASYASVGEFAVYGIGGLDLAWDRTGRGESFSSWLPGKLVNVGETWAPRNGQHFIRYGGLWGKIGQLKDTSGPASPSFQANWGSPTQVGTPVPPQRTDDNYQFRYGSNGRAQVTSPGAALTPMCDRGMQPAFQTEPDAAGFIEFDALVQAGAKTTIAIVESYEKPSKMSYDVLVNGTKVGSRANETGFNGCSASTWVIELDAKKFLPGMPLRIRIQNNEQTPLTGVPAIARVNTQGQR
jgi:hypothetical protein